jgi:hypothetical protein
MKTKSYDQLVIGILVGALLFLVIEVSINYAYAVSRTPGKVSKDYKDVGGNIDIEYYLEVSEDSIWVEGVDSKKVYSGTYADLDSLINADNL